METTRHTPEFGIALRGYDRDEVDDYIRALANERDELRRHLNELESVVDATVDYLQSRRYGWQVAPMADAPPPPVGESAAPPVRDVPERPTSAAFAAGVAITLALAMTAAVYMWVRTPAADSSGTPSSPQAARSVGAARRDIALPAAPLQATAVGAAQPSPEIIVSLTTETVCWISVAIDGERRVDRMLRRDEQFSAHARSEVLLRVGNAGAVSLKINGRPARPLGPAGQPTTARITTANLEQFLSAAGSR